MTESFVLLDDSTGVGSSRLYTSFAHERVCVDPVDLEQTWDLVKGDVDHGLHAVLMADYEWGHKLQQVSCDEPEKGLLRVLLFSNFRLLAEPEVAQWLAERDGGATPGIAGFMELGSSVSRADHKTAIEAIKAWIRAGETYQVNYTHRLHGESFGKPVSLYRRLRARQPVAFGALIALPMRPGAEEVDQKWVLSFSPELFVRHTSGVVETRPMKGTAPRGSDPQEDRRLALWLAADEKNRAENLMIVDLMRNDLGRIARVGSVKVPVLFSIEAYPTVFQMTSTVTAEIPPQTEFPSILRALFPCGSITGAPKFHTMELIARLEPSARGLYTGAIGWLDRAKAPWRCGNFCLSVAIRTLTLDASVGGTRRTRLGVGGGIVLDSVANEEFEETLTKTRFVTELDPGFTLFETFRVQRGRVLLVEAHLSRLAVSAKKLGFAFDEAEIRNLLLRFVQGAEFQPACRVRVDLKHDGGLAYTAAPIPPMSHRVARLIVSDRALDPAEAAVSGHKTSFRSTYDMALRDAEASGAFDAVLFNAKGMLTEGARTNVFVRLDGRWWTPPLHCGLLPGVMRARVLASPLNAAEREISREMFERIEALMVCNAIRGPVRAELLPLPDRD